MKKVYLFAFLACTSILITNGQNYVSSATVGESIDSVTVGSRVAYKVNPDPAIAGLSYMNASVFRWIFSNSLTLRKEDGTAVTNVVAEPGYVAENAISAVMPASTGTFTLTVNEKSQPKSGTGCEGTLESITIQALPRPTVNFTGSQNSGSCAASSYSLPLLLTGYGPWTLEYSVAFNGGLPVNYTITGGNAFTCGTISNLAGSTATSAFTLDVPSAQLASGVGEYEIKILNVFDRFALKSLDRTLVFSMLSDLPVSNSYKLYIYPTPDTNPIQHIKNIQ